MSSDKPLYFRDMCQRKFGKFLTRNGYINFTENYRLAQNGLIKIIDFQPNSSKQGKIETFTLNIGIYIENVVQYYVMNNRPPSIQIEDCSVYSRIGMLDKNSVDNWWSIEQGCDLEKFSVAEIKRKIDMIAFPFLDQFENLSDVAFYLKRHANSRRSFFPNSKVQRLSYAAIIFFVDGKTDHKLQALNQAIEESKDTELEEVVDNLKRKLL